MSAQPWAIVAAGVAAAAICQLPTPALTASGPRCPQTIRAAQDEIDLYEKPTADTPFLRVQKGDLPLQMCVLEAENGRYEIAWKKKVAWIVSYQVQGTPMPLTPSTGHPQAPRAGVRLGRAEPDGGVRTVSASATRVATAAPPDVDIKSAKPATPDSSSPGQATAAAPAAAIEENSGQLKFLWPVHGKLISEFGSNDAEGGIDIAAPEGAPVKAAQDGVVVYVGNEVKGHGNLILLRHIDDFVTAYAGASKLLVKDGEQVHRGQTIAHVGGAGTGARPALHFELRRGSTPVDPVPFLQRSPWLE